MNRIWLSIRRETGLNWVKSSKKPKNRRFFHWPLSSRGRAGRAPAALLLPLWRPDGESWVQKFRPSRRGFGSSEIKEAGVEVFRSLRPGKEEPRGHVRSGLTGDWEDVDGWRHLEGRGERTGMFFFQGRSHGLRGARVQTKTLHYILVEHFFFPGVQIYNETLIRLHALEIFQKSLRKQVSINVC